MINTIIFFEVDTEDEHSVTMQYPHACVLAEEFSVERCKDAEVISVFVHSIITADILDQLPKLKCICTRSVGYNHIDLAACTKHGITVCNVPDYGSHVIAEHVFALLLGTLRHIHEADERVEKGEFDYHGLRGVSLRGKTIGIVGTGKIGRRAAQIAHGFGMKILAVDLCRVVELQDLLGVQYVELDELLQESDIITLHLPVIDATRHMINADAFSKMKDDAILVNTARGELIDSDALLAALNAGKLSHALLDVLEHEQDFEMNKELIVHPKVVVTPHIAFYAEESMTNMYEDCFASIEQWQCGEEPEHVVKPPTLVCDMKGVQ
ncbi:MAG: NAD(P)-dependent oxidoreductase [bacterium]|nr:NAD(P)-dependent oxidoreductase [bacterium]